MNELRVQFNWNHRDRGWDAQGWDAELCHSGVIRYVELPEGLERFYAVFSDVKPNAHDSFELGKRQSHHRARLQTAEAVTYLREALDFMEKMYTQGYRYVRVEY